MPDHRGMRLRKTARGKSKKATPSISNASNSTNLASTVIGRKHDQSVLQPDLPVDISEQVSQRTVEPQQVVFAFKA